MTTRNFSSVVGALALGVLGVAVLRASEWTSLQLEGLNGTYRDVAPGVEWRQDRPIPMRFTSPTQVLELKSHRVSLRPAADGTHAVRVEVEFQGAGEVVGDVSGTALEDQLTLPLQRHEVAARVRIRRDGSLYEIETVEVQPTMTVEIRSRLAGQMVELCETLFSLMGVVCGGLEDRLSKAEVPLPEAGEIYYLPDSRLTEADRQALDAYLDRTEVASTPTVRGRP